MNTIEKALQKQKELEAKRKQEQASGGPVAVDRGLTPNCVNIDLAILAAAGMVTPDNGRSRMSEELRAIKRPLLRNAFGRSAQPLEHGNLIMVTSSMPGEGKSFTSINLAISIAMELDKTVLLIDADVAKPSMMKYLGLSNNEKGLVDYLVDKDLPLSDLLLKTNIPELTILPAGRQHHHSTELLASDAMLQLMKELSDRYPDRVVIFDSPPLLATSEARVLAGLVGQIVVVVEAVKTTEKTLKDALSFLNTETQVVNLLLNKYRGKVAGGYYYGTYGYGDKQSKREQ